MTEVAIAHDYLTQRGGAERVVLAMLRAFPEATLYTTLYNPEATYPEFADARIVTSPLNRIPLFRRDHRSALPFLSWAASTLQVEADVVISSSSGWAHGFAGDAKRLVYCYSPARWLYQSDTYLGAPTTRSAKGLALQAVRQPLIRWDKRMAARAERYLAISKVVQQRIKDTYDIDAPVVPAPHSFDPSRSQEPVPELAGWAAETGFHLVVSRLLPYKNVDQAITAFRGLPERLVVIGDGPQREALAARCSDNVRMVSGLSDAQMRWSYAHSNAIVAPSYEDYGLTPIEGGTYGKPTLALRAGGYLDTVADSVTGIFFDSPDSAAIRGAVEANRGRTWDATAITAHMEQFSEDHFSARLHQEVAKLVAVENCADGRR